MHSIWSGLAVFISCCISLGTVICLVEVTYAAIVVHMWARSGLRLLSEVSMALRAKAAQEA